ncbi:unnamed protein product [Rotaria sp. Silwood1]|nr:unnamed protein product [Rotaria sp. Silwood1]
MATAILPVKDADNQHSKIIYLIWLDANVNIEEVRDTEQKLSSIINHLKQFQDVKQCQKFIEGLPQNERVIMIVSGRLGREIVPSIHTRRQVISIYVYCMDKESNEKWACKFAKVKAVMVNRNELISRIQADHNTEKENEQLLSISIRPTMTSERVKELGINTQFVFSQTLINCLLRLRSTPRDKKELISCCKKDYEGNNVELSKLHEFEENYSPDKVLWWYTQESFFYKVLNRALRTENIHMIFLFRSFICDMHRQLEKYQVKHMLRVYRCQLMSNDELEKLKQNCGCFISINSFFSTSASRETAISYFRHHDVSKDLATVVFEIDADPSVATRTPFAEISAHGAYPNESEVLFMLGSIFRVNNVSRKQLGNGETSLQTLGKLLWKMGKLDLAENYFMRFVEELTPNDPLLIVLYEDLGKLTSEMGKFDQSVQWQQKSMALKNKQQSVSIISIDKPSSSIVKRQDEKRFNSGSLDIEWLLVETNADYLALLVRDFFAPYGADVDFEKRITAVQHNYIEKELKKKSDIDKISYLFDKAAKEKDPKYLIQAYTAETDFYRILNLNLAQAQLINIESFQIEINQHCTSIVGILTHHSFFDPFDFRGECYRGMSIKKSELDKYKKGSRILTKSFLSSSQTRDVAINFAVTSASSGTISILCIYNIRNRRSGLNLEQISEFPNEKEVLIMPYTAFKVIDVSYLDGDTTKIRAEIKLKECEPW